MRRSKGSSISASKGGSAGDPRDEHVAKKRNDRAVDRNRCDNPIEANRAQPTDGVCTANQNPPRITVGYCSRKRSHQERRQRGRHHHEPHDGCRLGDLEQPIEDTDIEQLRPGGANKLPLPK